MPDLQELRRLHEAATPGPWATCELTGMDENGSPYTRLHRGIVELSLESNPEDIEYITAACNALPALLDAAEALGEYLGETPGLCVAPEFDRPDPEDIACGDCSACRMQDALAKLKETP